MRIVAGIVLIIVALVFLAYYLDLIPAISKTQPDEPLPETGPFLPLPTPLPLEAPDHRFIHRGVCGIRAGRSPPPTGAVFVLDEPVGEMQEIPGSDGLLDQWIYNRETNKIRPFTLTMWMNTRKAPSRNKFRRYFHFGTRNDARIEGRFGEVVIRYRNDNWSSWFRQNPDVVYDAGEDGRAFSMFTMTCDGANTRIYYNDIPVGGGIPRPRQGGMNEQTAPWTTGHHTMTRFRIFDRALDADEVRSMYLDYFPDLHRPYMLRPYSLGILPDSEYGDHFDKRFLFSRVPPLHVYPRLFFGPKDIPAVRAMYASSYTGREYLKRFEIIAANTDNFKIENGFSCHQLGLALQMAVENPRQHPAGRRIANHLHARIMGKRPKILAFHERGHGMKWEKITLTYERDGLALGFDTCAYWMTSAQIKECEQVLILGVASRATKYDQSPRDVDQDTMQAEFFENKVMRRVSNQDVWDTSQLSYYKMLLHGVDGHDPEDIKFVTRKMKYFSRGTLTEMGNLVEPYGKSADQRMYLPTIALARITGENPQFNHPQLRRSTTARAMMVSPLSRYMNDHGTWGSAVPRYQMAFFNTVYSNPTGACRWWARLMNPKRRVGDDAEQNRQQYDNSTTGTGLLLARNGNNHMTINETRSANLLLGKNGGYYRLSRAVITPHVVPSATEDFSVVVDYMVWGPGRVLRVGSAQLWVTEDAKLHWYGHDDTAIPFPFDTRLRLEVRRTAGVVVAESGFNETVFTGDIGEALIRIGNPKQPNTGNQNLADAEVWPIEMTAAGERTIWHEPSDTELNQPIRWDIEGIDTLYMHQDHGLKHEDYPLTMEGIPDIPLDMTDADTGLMISMAGKSPFATRVYSWSMDGHGGHNGKVGGHYDIFGLGTLWVGVENRFAKYGYSYNNVSVDGIYPPGPGLANGTAIGGAATRNMCCFSYDLTPTYRYDEVVQKFETWGTLMPTEISGIDCKYAYRTIVNVRTHDERSIVIVITDLEMNDSGPHLFAESIQVPVHVEPGKWGSNNSMSMSAPNTPFNFRGNDNIFKILKSMVPEGLVRRCRVKSLVGPQREMTWTTQHRFGGYRQGVSNATRAVPGDGYNMPICKHIKLSHTGSGRQTMITTFYPHHRNDNLPRLEYIGNAIRVGQHTIGLEQELSGRTVVTLKDADGSEQSTSYM